MKKLKLIGIVSILLMFIGCADSSNCCSLQQKNKVQNSCCVSQKVKTNDSKDNIVNLNIKIKANKKIKIKECGIDLNAPVEPYMDNY